MLFQILQEHKHLEFIGLSGNQLDDLCLNSLSDCIHMVPELKALNLSFNNITDLGVKTLVEAIKNRKLELFDLQGNILITDDSIAVFVDLLAHSEIGKILVDSTSISPQGMDLIKYFTSFIAGGAFEFNFSRK